MFLISSILSVIVFFLMQDKYDVQEKKLLKKVEKEQKKAAKLAQKEGR